MQFFKNKQISFFFFFFSIFLFSSWVYGLTVAIKLFVNLDVLYDLSKSVSSYENSFSWRILYHKFISLNL